MLKIIKLSNLAFKIFKADDNKVVRVDNRANKMIINLFKKDEFRNLIYMLNIKTMDKPSFLIFNTKKTFNYLR